MQLNGREKPYPRLYPTKPSHPMQHNERKSRIPDFNLLNHRIASDEGWDVEADMNTHADVQTYNTARFAQDLTLSSVAAKRLCIGELWYNDNSSFGEFMFACMDQILATLSMKHSNRELQGPGMDSSVSSCPLAQLAQRAETAQIHSLVAARLDVSRCRISCCKPGASVSKEMTYIGHTTMATHVRRLCSRVHIPRRR